MSHRVSHHPPHRHRQRVDKIFNDSDLTVITDKSDEQLLQETLASKDTKVMFAVAKFLQSLLQLRGCAS